MIVSVFNNGLPIRKEIFRHLTGLGIFVGITIWDFRQVKRIFRARVSTKLRLWYLQEGNFHVVIFIKDLDGDVGSIV
jgi:hypothetical protein